MAVFKVIKDIEDLADLNWHRVTRGSPYDTKRFAHHLVSSLQKLSVYAESKSEDDELVRRLKDLLDEFIKSLTEAANQRGPYPAEDLDKLFEKLLEGMALIKAEAMEPWKPADFNSTLADDAKPSPDLIELSVQTLAGKEVKVHCDPKCTVRELKEQLRKFGGPRVPEQKLVIGDNSLENSQTLEESGVKSGAMISIVTCPVCEVCVDGPCKCRDCHGQGRYVDEKNPDGCPTCGTKREICEKCKGQCKCSACHGNTWRGCMVCGIRPPCWGGDTLVLLADGGVKKVRDCQVGDEVCTLRGSKRIARIWGRNAHLPQNVDTEVCCIDGVWITSHHPVISEGQWVFPVDIKPSAPWHQRLHLVPDMFNFELEGHDDTILLWAGLGGHGLVVSCTIGKYLGPRFGYGICTRRSTRCAHDCRQCDAVFVSGLEHNNIPSEMRWARFPEFPQVEWDDGVSEFDLAAAVVKDFVPPVLPLLSTSICPTCREGCLESVPLPTCVGIAA